MSDERLKRCPFCGGSNVRIHDYSKLGTLMTKLASHTPTMFECGYCGASVTFNNPLVNAADVNGDTSVAVSHWNRRING